jgi:hypothetical protein
MSLSRVSKKLNSKCEQKNLTINEGEKNEILNLS